MLSNNLAWLIWFGFLVLMIVSFYFLLVKPQLKKKKELEAKGYVSDGRGGWLPPITTTKTITSNKSDSPMEILQKRLARGEITQEEFDKVAVSMDDNKYLPTSAPMKILQKRLANGEITQEEFNKLALNMDDAKYTPMEILQNRLATSEITNEEFHAIINSMENPKETPMRILQKRLAKGEITLEEFNKLQGRM